MTFHIENARFIREDLIFKVEGTAEWRSERATEYPSDARNPEAAESLTRLAHNLWKLPDHPSWRRPVETWIGPDEDTALHVAETHSEVCILKRYGFYIAATGDPVLFLEGYMALPLYPPRAHWR